MKKFYYVHNRATGNPIKRHMTLGSAKKEALRLNKKTGKSYYILTSVLKITREGNIEDTYGERKILDA